jgi:hypothetical protein
VVYVFFAVENEFNAQVARSAPDEKLAYFAVFSDSEFFYFVTYAFYVVERRFNRIERKGDAKGRREKAKNFVRYVFFVVKFFVVKKKTVTAPAQALYRQMPAHSRRSKTDRAGG